MYIPLVDAQIASLLGPVSVRDRSDPSVSDRCRIDAGSSGLATGVSTGQIAPYCTYCPQPSQIGPFCPQRYKSSLLDSTPVRQYRVALNRSESSLLHSVSIK